MFMLFIFHHTLSYHWAHLLHSLIFTDKKEMVPDSKVEAIGGVLSDPSRPLKERFRALFTLRGLGGEVAINAISRCFEDPSALLKHELAYCLGQMGDVRAIPKLIEVLSDSKQEPMVRHEAGEALGAIGDPTVEDVLRKYSKDPCVDVAETCQLALGRLEWLQSSAGKDQDTKNTPGTQFLSIDPTPPAQETDIEKLRERLVDETLPLFERLVLRILIRTVVVYVYFFLKRVMNKVIINTFLGCSKPSLPYLDLLPFTTCRDNSKSF